MGLSTTAAPRWQRRRVGAAALALLLAGLAGCNTAPPGVVDDSLLSFDRTFNAALGAIADQKMTVGVQDRRNGLIVGTLDGDTITSRLALQHDGSIRVRFAQEGGNNPELLQHVVAAYNARTSNRSILGGFGDSGNQTGPVPCPSGPAFCK
ncbi:MAG TPA: hypothetical protein PKB14_16585 [Rubrivivax sp.]|mgnify:CR=1 FL=1|nr:hypothetical protein [Rubrivivax sp.]